ncbi:hypothetical protein GCM10010869_08980 [Mesorhizobium tianshanense]|nr:hypothetical protein GCM10010869_08980 [Mesorhizobium tianshanense]
MSRPREKRETGKQDLFRSRLDQIINMKHELVRLAQAIDWAGAGGAFWRRLFGRTGHAATADPADGGAGHPQAHFQPVR